jgi:undecaprenyl-diphosphatase
MLGLVQGLGEFLPISSSAHLVLVPCFFNWEDPGFTFYIALHLGTLNCCGDLFLERLVTIAVEGIHGH